MFSGNFGTHKTFEFIYYFSYIIQKHGRLRGAFNCCDGAVDDIVCHVWKGEGRVWIDVDVIPLSVWAVRIQKKKDWYFISFYLFFYHSINLVNDFKSRQKIWFVSRQRSFLSLLLRWRSSLWRCTRHTHLNPALRMKNMEAEVPRWRCQMRSVWENESRTSQQENWVSWMERHQISQRLHPVSV